MADALRVTVRHYYDFGADRLVVGSDLIDPAAWDRLRTSTRGVFSIPTTRDELARLAEEQPEIAARARAIDAWFEEQSACVVASYGVGGASLEWWLHQLRPSRKFVVTEYGQETVRRLIALLPDVRVCYHDLRLHEPLEADVHLFHRIDTELSNREWREVFGRFRSAEILVVAAKVLDARRLVIELVNRPRMRLRRASSAGLLRYHTHVARRLRMHDLDAWALAPREPDLAHRSAAGKVAR